MGDKQPSHSIETSKRPNFSSKIFEGSNFVSNMPLYQNWFLHPRIIVNIVSEKELCICFNRCKNLCYANCAKFSLKRTRYCALKFSLWIRDSSQDFSKPMQMFSRLPQRSYVKICITFETHSMTRSPNHGTSPP